MQYAVEEGVARIYERYRLYLTNLLRSLQFNKEDAEDAAQEIFIRFMRHVGKMQSDAHIKSWLSLVAHHIAIDRFRRDRRMTIVSLEVYLQENGDVFPVEDEEAPDVDAALQLLSGLPAKDKKLLWMTIVQGVSLPEAAQQYNVSYDTLRCRKMRAKSRLRKLHYAATNKPGGE